MRERLYGLGSLALNAVQRALQERKNWQLGYRILVDTGIVPTPEQRHLIAGRAGEVTASLPEGYSPALMSLAGAILEKCRLFGMPLPVATMDKTAERKRGEASERSAHDEDCLDHSVTRARDPHCQTGGSSECQPGSEQ